MAFGQARPLGGEPPEDADELEQGRGVATVHSETRDQFGEVVQVLVARLVVPPRMQPELPGNASKESCTATGPETSPAPRPVLTETPLDPLRGRQRIEASPEKEQVNGGEMG